MLCRMLVLLVLAAGGLASAPAPAAPTCALVVQVVDEAGSPAPGIAVRVTVGTDAQTQTAGKDGVAELTALPCGEAVIAAGHPGQERFNTWSGTTRILRPDMPANARVVIVGRTEVSVRVADSQGRPVSWGTVMVVFGPGNGDSGPPDENGIFKTWLQPGRWQIEWLSSGPNRWVSLPPGPPSMTGGGTITEVGSEPAVIDLVVNGRERLEGRIVDSDGRPLSGMHVIGRNAEWQTSAESLADGRFVLYLRELPSVLEPVSFGRALAFDPPRLSVQEAPSAPLVFVGRPSARPLLHGRVVRKGSGEPVAGVRVQIQPDCGGAVPEGLLFADVAPVTLKTEPDGSFEARCAPECPFAVTARGKAAASSEEAGLSLPAGACDHDLVVELERRPSWVLEGTVADRKGVPLEGLPVGLSRYVEKKETRDAVWYPEGQTGRTGEGGRFRIEGQWEGRYRVEVKKQDTPKALRDLVIVSKRSPGTRFEVTLKAEDAKSVELRAVPGASVCARAVDAKNAPLALHFMALYAADEDVVLEDARWQRDRQDRDRVCLEGVVPGRYRVLLGKGPGTLPAWYPGTDDSARAQPVEIASGMNELDPVVMRATGGLILDFPGWSGSEPPRIEYREARKSAAAPDPRPWTVFPASGVELRPDKRFTVYRFPAGSWEVRACPGPVCEKDGEIRSTANPVEVRQGILSEVTLDVAQATSLLGVPLFSLWWPPPTRFKLESELDSARKASERAPDDSEALIWRGRRTAYLGRYREAVAIFSRGVERWPEDARFLRHRGHRWITLRRFDEAIVDLRRATKLIAGQQDSVEADGQPNAAGIPTSSLHTNVWYHLGLAHFLKGEFEAAREAFAACLAAAGNDDMRVAASDWLYMSLRRLGRGAEARKVLEPVRADLRLLENGAYLDRLLLYRGERTPAQLLAAGGDDVQIATHGFGVGHWHLVEGRPAEAEATFERVVEGAQWAAFGFIAAEAELARIRASRASAR